jgi:hypothetical protein
VVILFVFSAVFCERASAAAAGLPSSAEISGVVRDSQGVAQMGALVQVLSAGARTAGTAFTDQHGRYAIANLDAGRYVVRASATLYVPTTKANLELRSGANAVVDLTLAALFDPTSWLPAQRRRGDEGVDDWKWTLRSTANRPILRVVNNGELVEVSSSTDHAPAKAEMRARETVASGDGEFGHGGLHNIVTIDQNSGDGIETTMRADIGTRDPAGRVGIVDRGSPTQFAAGYEQRGTFGGAMRTVMSYQSHPELVASAGVGATGQAGLQVLELTTGERFAIGDRLEVEAGGRLQGVHGTVYAIATHPFLRVALHPAGTWTMQYRLATDRDAAGFEDVTPDNAEVPVALIRNGHLALESGRHQELSATRKTAKVSVAVAVYHDSIQRTGISGGGASAAEPLDPSLVGDPAGAMLVDPTTGTFRALADGYTSSGARVTVSAPLAKGLWIAAEYSTGDAIAAGNGPEASFAEALAGLSTQQAQASMVALQGRVAGSGTRVRASYRSQTSKLVTAVDPYSDFAEEAYLSFLLEQPIRFGTRLPKGLNAMIDVTNLLAQGYRPFLSADGQTLYFAQAPRTIQAGLSFKF